MKRTWIAVLLLILSAMPAAAAGGLSVYTPVANENLEIGVPAVISWIFSIPVDPGGHFSGPFTETFKIVLMHGRIELGTIVENLSFQGYASGPNFYGSYVWTAGNYLFRGQARPAGAGTGYSVKIQTMSNSFSKTSGPFTLSVKPTTPPPPPILISKEGLKMTKGGPAITITSPKAGDNFVANNVLNVKWIKIGTMDQNVSVTLLSKGAVVATLAASTPNNGTFSSNPTFPVPLWIEPFWIERGAWFTVRVRTLDRGVEAVSGEFTLYPEPIN